VDAITARVNRRDVPVGPTGYWIRLDTDADAPLVSLGWRAPNAESIRLRLNPLTDADSRTPAHELTLKLAPLEPLAPTPAGAATSTPNPANPIPVTMVRWKPGTTNLESDPASAPARRLPLLALSPERGRASVLRVGIESVTLPADTKAGSPWWIRPALTGRAAVLAAAAGSQGWVLTIANKDRNVKAWVVAGPPAGFTKEWALPNEFEAPTGSTVAYVRAANRAEDPRRVNFPLTADAPTARTAPPLVPKPDGPRIQGPGPTGSTPK